jgi:predicted O-methyltransferase YrrM
MQLSGPFPFSGHQLKEALRFYRRAVTGNHLHAPVAYSLWEALCNDKRWYYAFSEVETLRDELSHNHHSIDILDLGAGSRTGLSAQRKISDLVKNAAITSRDGRRLFRLVQWFQPKGMIELGTSLGISTLYQAHAARYTPFWSLEGCPETARLANKYLRRFDVPQVQLVQASFDIGLPTILQNGQEIDYWYVDGNHQLESTLAYWETFLEHAPQRSVFVLNDLYWSEGMTEAWNQIRQDTRCQMTIDLFSLGVAVRHPNIELKQDYAWVPRWSKPWRLGFWP